MGLLSILTMLRGLPWKAIGAIALAAGIFFGGWTVNGWRWQSKWNTRETAYSKAAEKSSEEARAKEADWNASFAAVDKERETERTKANEEIARLRAAVDDGTVRLRVRAHCPAPGLPQSAGAPGNGDAAAPELDSAARQDYFALRQGILDLESQLNEAQDLLERERHDAQR